MTRCACGLVMLAVLLSGLCGCGYINPKPPACVMSPEAMEARLKAGMLPVGGPLYCYRCYKYDGFVWAEFKTRAGGEYEPGKTIVCSNDKAVVEHDFFYSGRMIDPPPELQKGMRPESPGAERLDHYLVLEDGAVKNSPVADRTRGDYWFLRFKEISATEAEKLLKEWNIRQGK